LHGQAINVIDNPDFRRFALYGRDEVSEHNLPHRTKLLDLVFQEYEREHRKQVTDFKVMDAWSLFNHYEE
jgi:hypothetical protein